MMPRRLFSATQADYKDLHEEMFYTPERKLNFGAESKMTIFHHEGTNQTIAPFEIKEATTKCGLGFFGALFIDKFMGLSFFYPYIGGFFALNWIYTV